MRILITGHPGVGKTTLGSKLSEVMNLIRIRSDDYLHMINKEEVLAEDIEQNTGVIEGTLIPWALKAWFNIYWEDGKKPFDLLFHVKSEEHRILTPSAKALGKAHDKVLWEVMNHPHFNPEWKPLDIETQMW